MQDSRPVMIALSAETSAAADLDEVRRWLIASQWNPLRLDVGDLPALGQGSMLRFALPMTAPRAVLCAMWLHEDVEAGGCLLAGQLRFVAHPTASDIRLSFSGQTAGPMRSGQLGLQAHHAARQLVEVIADTIQRPFPLFPPPAARLAAPNRLS